MQAYGAEFARVYNKKWNDFSKAVAPKIERLIAAHDCAHEMPRTLLDVCCGTGRLAAHFLALGYRVQGIDLSPHMLSHAIRNNRDAVDSGRATFTEADAASFSVAEPVSYATCLYDAMNHLPAMDAISSCIRRVHESLLPKGLFVFDVNTRKSLQNWNHVSVQEDEGVFILNRGMYEESMDRAYAHITGFIRDEDGRYTRFSETAYNLVLDLDTIESAIRAAGFPDAYLAGMEDLTVPAADRSSITRAFFICRKA
jgi:SAM-dependent methyltransferase